MSCRKVRTAHPCRRQGPGKPLPLRHHRKIEKKNRQEITITTGNVMKYSFLCCHIAFTIATTSICLIFSSLFSILFFFILNHNFCYISLNFTKSFRINISNCNNFLNSIYYYSSPKYSLTNR